MFRRARPPAPTGAARPAPGLVPIWLPGGVRVAIVGETFYQDANAAAASGIAQGSLPVETVVLEPDNRHDNFAVGVHLNGRPAGHLLRDVVQRVKLSIRAFMDANEAGRQHARPEHLPRRRCSDAAAYWLPGLLTRVRAGKTFDCRDRPPLFRHAAGRVGAARAACPCLH